MKNLRTFSNSSKVLVSGPPRNVPPHLSSFGPQPAPGKGRSRPGQSGTAVEPPKRLPLGEKPPSAQGGPRIQRMEKHVTNWLEKGEGSKFRNGTQGPNWISSVPFPLNPTFRPPPPLSDKLKSIIYHLYKEDSIKNTPSKLSIDFKISVDRIKAIIKLKILENQWITEGKALQVDHLKGMEKHLGVPKTDKRIDNDNLSTLDLISKTKPVDVEPAQVDPEPSLAVLPAAPRSESKSSLHEQNIFLNLTNDQISEAKESQEKKDNELDEKTNKLDKKNVESKNNDKGVNIVNHNWEFIDTSLTNQRRNLSRN